MSKYLKVLCLTLPFLQLLDGRKREHGGRWQRKVEAEILILPHPTFYIIKSIAVYLLRTP